MSKDKFDKIGRLLAHDKEWTSPMQGERTIKRRLQLVQRGIPFMLISTTRTMLEVIYDVLEVTRYLRARSILHRDISSGNITYDGTIQFDKPEIPPNLDVPLKEDICFVKYLLGESSDANKTSALLIDFNGSEIVGEKKKEKTAIRTGTSLFVARAVEAGKPFPEPPINRPVSFPAIPQAAPVYERCHPTRVHDFSGIEEILLPRGSTVLDRQPWNHELDHDAESIFWVILYWFVCANPYPQENQTKENIDIGIWSAMQEGYRSRHRLLSNIMEQAQDDQTMMHSKLSPAANLLAELAAILYPGRYYLPKDDKRSRPEYLHEAFQRAILNFIITNQHAEFMDFTIDVEKPRTKDFATSRRRTG